jgi:hypothetical protein
MVFIGDLLTIVSLHTARPNQPMEANGCTLHTRLPSQTAQRSPWR